MGCLTFLICLIAAVRLQGEGGIFVVAVLVAIAGFWSWGVMHNFQSDTENPEPPPRFAVLVNMLSFVAGVVLLITSFVK